ncbi:hypothetical protein OH77DRAFT_741780 [Trametes cingulata]|nr:hypothetical protein OH77DRAFT_741780 [Trametes cingulata]
MQWMQDGQFQAASCSNVHHRAACLLALVICLVVQPAGKTILYPIVLRTALHASQTFLVLDVLKRAVKDSAKCQVLSYKDSRRTPAF